MKILSAIIYLTFSLSVQAEVLHCSGGGFGILPIEAVALECKGQNSGKMYDALLGSVMVGMGVKFERLIISCPVAEGDALLGIYDGGRGQVALAGGVSAGYFQNSTTKEICYTVGIMGGASIGVSVGGVEIKPWGQGFKRNK